MKIKNVVLLTLLGAGSLQASIIQTSSAATYSSGLISQNFNTATANPVTAGNSLGNTGTGATTTTFAGVSLSSTSSTTLYYDPNVNSTFGCNTGNNPTTPSIPTTLTNCISDYTNAGNAGASSMVQTGLHTIAGTSPYEFTVSFGSTQLYASSLLFAVTGSGTTPVFEVEVLKGGTGGTVVDTSAPLMGNVGNAALQYLNISESSSFDTIEVIELNNFTYGSGAYGQNGFTFVAGNLTATTAPEPGTIGLIGLGLAGVGFVARRRRKA